MTVDDHPTSALSFRQTGPASRRSNPGPIAGAAPRRAPNMRRGLRRDRAAVAAARIASRLPAVQHQSQPADSAPPPARLSCPTARPSRCRRHQHAIEADDAADNIADHHRRLGRRPVCVDRGEHQMRGHRPRHVGRRANARNRSPPAGDGRRRRQRLGLFHPRAAVPRHVLDHRQHRRRAVLACRAEPGASAGSPPYWSPITASAPGPAGLAPAGNRP